MGHACTEALCSLQVPTTEGLKIHFKRREEILSCKRTLVGGSEFEKTRVASGMYKPHPTRFHLHLNEFVLIPTRIWWTSSLHGNSPFSKWSNSSYQNKSFKSNPNPIQTTKANHHHQFDSTKLSHTVSQAHFQVKREHKTTTQVTHPNLHNITPSLISRNPKERMCSIQNSPLGVTCPSHTYITSFATKFIHQEIRTRRSLARITLSSLSLSHC